LYRTVGELYVIKRYNIIYRLKIKYDE
jgi:hypothetical protein